MLLHRRHVLRIVAPSQQPAVHFWVQRLHAAVHHLREPRNVLDAGYRDLLTPQRLRRAARGDYFPLEVH